MSETTYEVVYKDWDGTVLKSEQVLSGASGTPPEDPVRAHYTFTGWDRDVTSVTADLVVHALYEPILHTVVFRDYNEVVLSTQSVLDGGTALSPLPPKREGFVFEGWDMPFDNVTEDITTTARYTVIPYKTVIRIYNEQYSLVRTIRRVATSNYRDTLDGELTFSFSTLAEALQAVRVGFIAEYDGDYFQIVRVVKSISNGSDMAYTNSPMVAYTKLSPNHSGQRTHGIDRITPHCVVGQCSVETLGNIFYPTSRQASSNYGIGADGRVGMYVEEKNRSWCSSSKANDQRAITIECASDTTAPYAFKEVVYQTLIKLCIDICQRNGKKKLLWLGDKDKTLNYSPKSDEMVLTVHRWFANKSCPGDWMYDRMGDLASKVTVALGGRSSQPETPDASAEKLTSGYYRVRKTWKDAKSQIGAYRVLTNAKAQADRNPGYYVFSNDGAAIYPAKAGETYRIHTVVKGDTLWKIAKEYLGNGSRYPEIKKLNGLTSNVIYSGWRLKIPN